MSNIISQGFAPANSEKSAPRLTVVGCGAIAKEYYLLALSRYPSVMEKLILGDRDDARAQALATEFKSLIEGSEALESMGQRI